jgi:uridine kinase
MQKPLIIGIAGGTGSGKTTITEIVAAELGKSKVAVINHDSYYRDISTFGGLKPEDINYDHPEALETELLIEHISCLKKSESVQKPIYDFAAHARKKETQLIEPKPVIIIDGILILCDERLRNLFDLKIFVDTDADERFIRRLIRDIKSRGRSIESVANQYLSSVKPMHLQFVEPSKRWADIIIPHGGKNKMGINIILARITAFVNQTL